ncbi:MAG: HEAT repeat domain-containing protein [Myxococcales bacterium]|nr:HEAT repeat domain-containing protein [Myxococcales bacterium]
MTLAASLRHAAGLCRCRDQHVEHSAVHAPGHGARPFPLPGTKRVYERDRPFAIEHIAIDLALDVPNKSIEGTAILHLRRVDARATSVRLDAVGFELRAVTLGGRRADYAYDDEVLVVEVPTDQQVFEISVAYQATPKRGLYFLAPDDHVQDRPRQVWSQCQDEDARHWFPCHDKPHVKQTTELTVRVPQGWYALGNGVLASRRDVEGGSVFHWKQEQPHSSYLVTLAAGEFAEITAESELPVTYLVPKDRVEDGRRTFARTPQMIALFEKKTGVRYPWPKYAQIVVHDFIFGGMENTSATTMYEHILLDARAAIDVDMDGLVAHELAHQWFGDYVTCRDWSEGWLNEGWATYMELVWKDEGSDPQGSGRDEYDYAIEGELDIYLAEDGRYRRPIVCRDYEYPIELFDRHLYQKGALVLHALRRAVGDAAFWDGVQSYLKKHALGNVETRDFQRALEHASGRSLDRQFDAYVHGGGHPELHVKIEHEPGEGTTVTVRQSQKVDELTKLYEGPLVLELRDADGKVRRETVQLTSARDTFLFVGARPKHLAVDPDGDLLATVEVEAPGDLLRDQLTGGSRPRVRWRAAKALAKRDEPKTVAALAATLADTKEFWGVRVEAAEALGAIRGEAALAALIAQSKVSGPAGSTAAARVRRAVAHALGRFKVPAAAEALRPLALADESYLVASEAARSLGATRQASTFDLLLELLDRRSWADVVRSGAADGLAALRDDRAIPHLVARTTYGHESPGRRACLAALSRLDTSRKTRELLEERLDDVDVFVRRSAIASLESLGDVKARPALSARLEREDAPMLRRRLREALRDLTAGRDAEVKRVKDDLERVREEAQELRARLAKLEAKVAGEPDGKVSAVKPAPKKKAARPAPKKRRR